MVPLRGSLKMVYSKLDGPLYCVTVKGYTMCAVDGLTYTTRNTCNAISIPVIWLIIFIISEVRLPTKGIGLYKQQISITGT